LLARRTVGRDLAGLWEFPGGKIERGETPEQALVRELREELGIQVQPGPHIITVPQAYPDKRLRLDVRRVTAWKGVPKGHEGQALAWVPLHKLSDYAMPPADIPVVAALTQPDRYLVTPPPAAAADTASRAREAGLPSPCRSAPYARSRVTPPGPHTTGLDASSIASSNAPDIPDAFDTPDTPDTHQWPATVQHALSTGIRRLHLRLPPGLANRKSLLEQAVTLAHAARAQPFIGGDIELARTLGAGVHLRAAQLAQLHARPLPASLLVAASCHDEAELQHAQRLGCDFAVLGPVQPTPTHPEATGIGWT